MTEQIRAVLFIVGVCAALTGVAFIFWPLALILGGLTLAGSAFLAERWALKGKPE